MEVNDAACHAPCLMLVADVIEYRWCDGSDGRPRSWYVDVCETALEDEITFLRSEIYLRRGAQVADPDRIHPLFNQGVKSKSKGMTEDLGKGTTIRLSQSRAAPDRQSRRMQSNYLGPLRLTYGRSVFTEIRRKNESFRPSAGGTQWWSQTITGFFGSDLFYGVSWRFCDRGSESLPLRHRFWTAQKSFKIRHFPNRRILAVEHHGGAPRQAHLAISPLDLRAKKVRSRPHCLGDYERLRFPST
jgi:hypothetical protein